MLTLVVHRFWHEKSLAVCHSKIFANFVCLTAFWSRIFKWGIYFFDLDCARSYLNTLIYTCLQVYFSILNKICDMRVTSSGCFDVECLLVDCDSEIFEVIQTKWYTPVPDWSLSFGITNETNSPAGQVARGLGR